MEFANGIPNGTECQKKPLNGNAMDTFIVYKPSQEVLLVPEPIHFNYEEFVNK